MATFIRCPSCAFLFGPYLKFIDLARQAQNQEKVFSKDSQYKDFDPDKLALNPGSVPPLEGIFDALNITNRCCRMRITARTDFDTMFK